MPGVTFPHSAFPSSGGFPNFHIGTGNQSIYDEGLGVASSILSDVIWYLRFQMPPSLPAGTAKLLLRGLCNAPISGNARVNPKWRMTNPFQDPSTGTLVAEGVQTIAFAHNLNRNIYQDTKFILDGDTVTASGELTMNLTFEAASWTLNYITTWIPSIIWE